MSPKTQYLDESRREMLKLNVKGVPPVQFMPDIARKYDRSLVAVKRDWTRRKTWIPRIVQLEDPTFIQELVEGLKQVIPNAWYEYTQADNSNAKIGALRLVKDLYYLLITLGMELGIKPEAATTEVFTWKEPSWLHDTVDTNPTGDNGTSIKAKQDSESSHAADDGAKQ